MMIRLFLSSLILLIMIHAVYAKQENDKQLMVENFNYQQQSIKSIEDDKQKYKKVSIDEDMQEETFTLTFYTSLIEENSEYGAVTCSGSRLIDGVAANNVLPQGTKIMTKEFGELTIADKGGGNFNTTNRLDVFISRKHGESDYQYKKRVNDMGVVKVIGYIIK